MTVVALISVFAGMIVGLRLNVIALVLATVVAGLAAFTYATMTGLNGGGIALTAIIAIQLGYGCATFAMSLKDAPVADTAAEPAIAEAVIVNAPAAITAPRGDAVRHAS